MEYRKQTLYAFKCDHGKTCNFLSDCPDCAKDTIADLRAQIAAADSLQALRQANIQRDQEWSKGVKLSLTYRGNELAGEIGEACNILKKLEREKLGMPGSRASVAKLAEELADGLICLDLIAMDFGIDLFEVTAAKFNKTSSKNGLATMLTPHQVTEI